jgi:hypothetical protein
MVRGEAVTCARVQNRVMTPTGLEPDGVSADGTSNLRQTQDWRAAESGAVDAPSGPKAGPVDADLTALIAAWPALPTAVKRRIVRLVEDSPRE